MLARLRELNDIYGIAVSEQEEAERVICDIEHELELHPHAYHERARLANLLADTLKRRRSAKDTQIALKPLREMFDLSSECVRAMERTLGEMRRADEKLQNRIYMPRSDIDFDALLKVSPQEQKEASACSTDSEN